MRVWLVMLVGLLGCTGGTGAAPDAALDTREAADATEADSAAGDAEDTGDAADDEPSDSGVDSTMDAVMDSADEADSEGDSGPPPLPPYPDLELGPYASLLDVFSRSAASNALSKDTSASYGDSAAQGYILQAIAEVLIDAQGFALESREELIEIALGEIDELREADALTTTGGPAFGLDRAWDAFGDGSTNPTRTAYTWQSGMVALGIAKIAHALQLMDHARTAEVRDYGLELVAFWDGYYSSASPGGYWWYSTRSSDAKAVHNTSALVAMAAIELEHAGATTAPIARARQAAELLWARMSGNPTTGYVWNYVDDGWPVASRSAEDISHAAITLQFMRAAGAEGWWSSTQMQGVSNTLIRNIWNGNPARLAGRVNGDTGPSDASWTRTAGIGFAAHADSPGGNPRVFELARSILFSSYFSQFERPVESASIDSGRLLAVALLLSHRPDAFENGSRFAMAAGDDDDDSVPTELPGGGGTRFYTVDWAAPSTVGAGLRLPARQATSPSANLLVDLEDTTGRVVVSLVYRASSSQRIQQWDGSSYQSLATLPATNDADGTARWMRTSFELRSDRFDYQAGVPGTNILLQLELRGTLVHSIEATPL